MAQSWFSNNGAIKTSGNDSNDISHVPKIPKAHDTNIEQMKLISIRDVHLVGRRRDRNKLHQVNAPTQRALQEGRTELDPGPEGIPTMTRAASAVEAIRTGKLALLREELATIVGR